MNDDGNGDFEAMLREAELRAAEQDEAVDRFAREMDELRVTAENQDGSVKVQVDSHGALRKLRLSDAVMRKSATELRDEIMRGVERAQRHLITKADELVTSLYGPASGTASVVAARYRAQFSEPVEETR